MTQQNSNKQQNSIDEDEIDLIALAKTLLKGRKTVIKTTLIFMVIGLFVAIFSEKEYTASTTFVPQISDTKIGGNLGGLAAMAGINLGSVNSGSEISPTLYPQIISSIPFQKELLETKLNIEGIEKPLKFSEYYTKIYNPGIFSYIKKFTIGLPGLIKKIFKKNKEINKEIIGNKSLFSISLEEKELIDILENNLTFNVENSDDGYVVITGKMPEALASAQLTLKAQELLQQYIVNFKIQKSKEQLKFIQERYTDKEKEFKSIQQKLALYRDRNRNVNSSIAQTTLERLQSEYDLVYGVYSELAKQLEMQQLTVKEDTPVFTVLKPVSIPIEKSKPMRIFILILWTFLGIVTGIASIFGIYFLGDLKEKWNNK